MEVNDLRITIKFVANYLQVNTNSLSEDTKLGADLGLDGDDADEFMQSFATEFAVDLSGFEFDKHFGVEAGFNPLSFIVKKITGQKRDLKDVSLKELHGAAIKHRW